MRRLNRINHSYFNSIDTEYKAYILGFIYADGCIVDNDLKRQKSLRIAIQYEDGYILQQLLDDIVPGRIIRKRYPPAAIKAGEKPQAVVSINSNELCESLIKLGCIINKTKLGLNMPSIPEHLQNHFVRGFFDGDGCITVNTVKNRYQRIKTYKISNPFKIKLRKRIIFTSTDKQFLNDIIILTGIKFNGTVQCRSVIRTLEIHKVSIEHQLDIPLMQNYMYNNASVYLCRKFDKFNMTIKSQAESKLSEGVETT